MIHHGLFRRVTYGRVLDIPIMLIQDVLSMTACPFQTPLLFLLITRCMTSHQNHVYTH